MTKRNCRAALHLAREYYGDNKLKRNNVRPTKLDDFEGIAKHHDVNIICMNQKRTGERMQDLSESTARFSIKTTCPQ